MATQASTLYGNNIRHMLDDLTPGKDGRRSSNMEDDVIRGATVDPRRRRHLSAAAAQGAGDRQAQQPKPKAPEETPRAEGGARARRVPQGARTARRRCWSSARC